MRFARILAALSLLCALLASNEIASTSRTPLPTPPLVLVSLDGFRADYLTRAPAVRLRQLAAAGVSAERLIPPFPSKTYPSHYTIVTGLWPEHHGIVSNTMFDPSLGRFTVSDTGAVRDARWWGGEPLWVTTIRQGRKAMTMNWPGSEAAIRGIRPTEWRRFDVLPPNDQRLSDVLGWLGRPAGEAPAFVTFYLGAADTAGHRYGPDAPETDSAIARTDRIVGRLVDGLRDHGLTQVNLIILADHGMAAIDPSRTIYLDDHIDLAATDVVELNPIAALRPRAGRDSAVYAGLARAPHLAAYRRADIPARYHYRENARIAPIIAVAEEGWTISTRATSRAHPLTDRGNHGFDPELRSMGGVFIAVGPAFARGRTVPPVHSVHLYALMAHLLGLTPAPNDGSVDSVRGLLR